MTNMFDPNCDAVMATCNLGNGIWTQYYASGQVQSQQDQLGRSTAFVYSGDPTSVGGGTTKITDPKRNVTVDSYQYGVLTSQTKGHGTTSAGTWQYRYDPVSAASVLAIDPDGNATATTVDPSGNVLSTLDPMSRTTSATYNSFNEPRTQTDGNGVTTTSMYDANGNLTSVSRPLLNSSNGVLATQTTSYCYYGSTTCGAPAGPVGDLYSMTDPDGNVWLYTYDAYGDRATVTDPLGHVSTTCYNTIGWALASYTPKAGAITCATPSPSSPYETQYGYVQANSQVDQFGDVQTVTNPLGQMTTMRDDADRNPTSQTDATGETTTFDYDLANELTDTMRPGGTDLKTAYFVDGTVKNEKDGTGTDIVAYTYDGQARVSTVVDALNQVTKFGYDAAGNETSKIDPSGSCTAPPVSGCTSMTYDAANELASVSYSDTSGANVSNISYDGDGQRQGLTDGTGNSSWTYDSLRRLTTYTNGAGAVVGYDYLTPTGQYDLKDQVGHIVYPHSAGTVAQAWDAVGRLASVEDWNSQTVGFGYDANSNLQTETVPSSPAVTDTFGYDTADRMASVAVSNGTSLFSATYTRNSDELLKTDSSVPAGQDSYKYSELNQICYAGPGTTPGCPTPPSGSYPYTYDHADNLTTTENSTQSGSTAQQFDAADRLCWTVAAPAPTGATCAIALTNATTFQYDVRDNRTATVPPSGSATCYGYDQANRLTAITAGTGTACTSPTPVASYGYDADGLRMNRTVSSLTTQFSWDVAGTIPLLLQETNATATTNYIYGPGGLPIEQIAGGVTSWLHHDQLGSTRLVTNAAGAAVAGYTYDPYGNLVASSGTASTAFRFAGQYLDTESGFYYLRMRYYDPATAQFLSRDPAVSLTRSPYGYVAGNPLNVSDPLGLWGLPDLNPVDWAKAGAGAVGKAASTAWNATGGKAVNWVQHNLCFTPGNSRCEPLAPTVGVCANAGIYGGIGYSGGVCLVASGGFQHVGLTFSGGAGVGLGGGISGGPMVSNAPCINALSGPFAEGGGGAGPFAGNGQVGANGVWTGSGGFGYSTPEGYGGATRTIVWQWW